MAHIDRDLAKLAQIPGTLNRIREHWEHALEDLREENRELHREINRLQLQLAAAGDPLAPLAQPAARAEEETVWEAACSCGHARYTHSTRFTEDTGGACSLVPCPCLEYALPAQPAARTEEGE